MYKSMISIIFIFLTTLNANAGQRPLRYLAIHGGGIAGLAPIYFLKQIEKEVNEPISSVIDGVAGISSGAMSAASICGPNASFSNERFQDDFVRYARSTFSPSNIALRKADLALDTALKRQFGGAYMSQSSCHLLIVSRDRNLNEDVIFDSELAKDAKNDLPIWQAVRASSSIDIPFFGPFSSGTVEFNNTDPKGGFSDPGLHTVSDPIPHLVERINALHPNRLAIIYSLGTGISKRDAVTRLGNIVIIHLEPDYDDVLGSALGTMRYTLSISSNMSTQNIDDVETRAKKMLKSWQYTNMLKEFREN